MVVMKCERKQYGAFIEACCRTDMHKKINQLQQGPLQQFFYGCLMTVKPQTVAEFLIAQHCEFFQLLVTSAQAL